MRTPATPEPVRREEEPGGRFHRNQGKEKLPAAHAEGPGSLWFTLFDRETLRTILGVDAAREPPAPACVGYPGGPSVRTPRETVPEKTRYPR